ncbi:MAG: hypothetical protein ACTTI6_03265 [Treponema sp.]
MNGRFNRIFAYLNRKKDEQFSGSIKLSFESGVCMAISEANRHDVPVTRTDDTAIAVSCLAMAEKQDFNGAVVFVFESGKITEYSYSKTYRGDTLKKLLGD